MPILVKSVSDRVYEHMRFGQMYQAAELADVIWPRHGMTKTGAGTAAARILQRMQKEGLVEWQRSQYGKLRHSGWVKL